MVIDKTGEIPIIEGQLPLPQLDGEALPSQLDDLDGDGEWDELAFTMPIDANSKQTISLIYVDGRRTFHDC